LAYWTGEYDPVIEAAYKGIDTMDDEIRGYMIRLFPVIDDWLAGPYDDFNPIAWRLLVDVIIKTMLPYLFIYVLVVLWAHGWPEYDSRTWFRLQNRRYWGGKRM